jgi:hypothetical protein
MHLARRFFLLQISELFLQPLLVLTARLTESLSDHAVYIFYCEYVGLQVIIHGPIYIEQ